MKTDYFSTFLTVLNADKLPAPGPAPSPGLPQVSALSLAVSVSVNLDEILLKLTLQNGELPIAQLARTVKLGLNDLAAALSQLQQFGLVTVESGSVRLTEQGKDFPTSAEVG
ncbi:hypothetical protein ACELLULO517_05895 [Acidisoma cellulosilytica]|uniref:Uncharacterized protein n=1 Tax=Acidisoma cellulosilyticum TaxID=2802395 RepID=A0A963Z0T3_9PROT|nr:hypothetical protein [Acidisoma cellulosilyticum]MCB8879758.1 hypothetical protein [Acidisoma cellulosilyticum]